ncbi:hypothetical protein KEJ51_00540 [Candidatus Bathyarchaeota archaeon]|nr:hypothetical protein [Candidatus Bathyarchaeota archaeon]MBS7629266.1 hypothetical protein [Candidatus Bathyarchaeota archaeon]
MKGEDPGFRAGFGHIIPQIWTLILAGFLSTYLNFFGKSDEVLTVFPETIAGASLNSIIFLAPLFAIATVIYLLVKMGLINIVRYLIRVSLVFSTFLITSWFASKYVESSRMFGYAWLIMALTSTFLTVILISAVYRCRGLTRAISLASIGSMTGAFLATVIPFLSAVVFLGALAFYDLISVYKGPVGKLARNQALEDLTGAVFNVGDLTVGVGDMVFYSMLASMAFSSFGPITYVMVSSGILFGTYLDIRILESTYCIPGLPIPVTFGLAILLICRFIAGL